MIVIKMYYFTQRRKVNYTQRPKEKYSWRLCSLCILCVKIVAAYAVIVKELFWVLKINYSQTHHGITMIRNF